MTDMRNAAVEAGHYLTIVDGQVECGYEVMTPGYPHMPLIVTYYSPLGTAVQSSESHLWEALNTGGWTQRVTREEFWAAIDYGAGQN
jgi:hypothetical protein